MRENYISESYMGKASLRRAFLFSGRFQRVMVRAVSLYIFVVSEIMNSKTTKNDGCLFCSRNRTALGLVASVYSMRLWGNELDAPIVLVQDAVCQYEQRRGAD